MCPRSDTWLMEELRLDSIFQLPIVNSGLPPPLFLILVHSVITYPFSTKLEILRCSCLVLPLFTFCHDHNLVILPLTSFRNVFLFIHFHIHSPASCPYQCSIGLQEPPFWPSCFLSFPATVHSLARLLLKF